jgi:hypothetical protein
LRDACGSQLCGAPLKKVLHRVGETGLRRRPGFRFGRWQASLQSQLPIKKRHRDETE